MLWGNYANRMLGIFILALVQLMVSECYLKYAF